ncbi:MAG: MFS transporter [Acetivibrio sp.]
MLTVLLIMIYLSFISLGLPDSLLGSAWPSMHPVLCVPVSFAGVISMLIAGGTIVSSLYSHRFIKKLGTGKITAISVGMTALSLFGFATAPNFIILCLWALPYGLGAGSVDAALNNFVALHYKAKHMNWLHCFWGIGATMGPYIMGYFLTGGESFSKGYQMIGMLQLVLTGILIFTLPLWKTGEEKLEEKKNSEPLKLRQMLKIPGSKQAFMAFFAYCALESTAGLWGSSYMVMERGIRAQTAAKWMALFYLGITGGRFLGGFLATKVKAKYMIRLGQGIMILGIATLFFPLGNIILCIGFLLMGMGCAPVYPGLLHETPDNFGREFSQAIMGIQMACAYVGSTFMPPLFGLLAQYCSIGLFPLYLMILALLMIGMVEFLHKKRDIVPSSTSVKYHG